MLLKRVCTTFPTQRVHPKKEACAVVREWQALGTTAVLSLNDVPAGAYALRIDEGERTEVVRVVKE